MNFLFFIFFYNILIYISGQKNNYCDIDKYCDNCNICGQDTKNYCSCNFYNLYCKNRNSNNYTILNDFLYPYDGCIKSNGQLENICGISNLDIDIGITKVINILSNNNKNLLCFYSVKKIKNNNNDINILIKNEGNRLSNINLFLIIYYNYNKIKVSTWYDLLIISNVIEIVELEAEKISVYIDIPDGNNIGNLSLYFSMENATVKTITYETNSNNKKIMLIFGIILGVLVLVAIILTICLIKKYCFKKTNNDNNSSNVLINSNISNLYQIKKNKEEINKLFKIELIPTTYYKGNIANNCFKCTICLEDFKEGSSIIVTTKCNHSFHLECFKNWVFNNIIIPKCPNCNKPILESDNNNQNYITTISINTQTQ